jgi:beta-mannosidase
MSIPEPPASYEFGELEPPRTNTHTVVVSARIVDAATSEVLSRIVDWPQPYRFIDFPDPNLIVSIEGEELKLEVRKPAKDVFLSVVKESGEVQWSDNGLDIMPGDPQTVTAKGFEGEKILIAYMGNERGFEM